MNDRGDAEFGAPVTHASRIVLALHRVVECPELGHDVSWEQFARLVSALLDVDAVGATLEPPLAGRSAVMTFDDGTRDHVTVGEYLAERGIGAIFFVPSGRIGEPAHLSTEQVAALRDQGHTVGSHTRSHRLLDRLSSGDVVKEVTTSKEMLEQIVGHRIDYFAPPGGVKVPQLDEVLEASGYRACRTMRWGVYEYERQRWTIPVVPVTELSARRGWIDDSLLHSRLPRTMRAVGAAKGILPPKLRGRLRGAASTLAARGKD
jgi:peptidoglycan/xylan/chitin deacetylase (PgdA/CDA1 family)